MKYAQDYGLEKVLKEINSFREKTRICIVKCSYLEKLVNDNKSLIRSQK